MTVPSNVGFLLEEVGRALGREIEHASWQAKMDERERIIGVLRWWAETSPQEQGIINGIADLLEQGFDVINLPKKEFSEGSTGPGDPGPIGLTPVSPRWWVSGRRKREFKPGSALDPRCWGRK